MSDPFHGPKRKLTRAKQHNEALIQAINGFFEDGGLAPQTGRRFGNFCMDEIKFTRGVFPADDVCLIAADLMINLRNSLDQAVTCSVNFTRGSRARETHFPTATTRDDLEDRLAKEMKFSHPDIVDIVRRIDPTREGQSPLWKLNALVNEDKHNWTIEPSIEIDASQMDPRCMPRISYNADQGRILVTSFFAPMGSFGFAVSVVSPKFGIREPLAAFCLNAIDECESLIMAVEAESLRIGPHQRP